MAWQAFQKLSGRLVWVLSLVPHYISTSNVVVERELISDSTVTNIRYKVKDLQKIQILLVRTIDGVDSAVL